MTAIAKRIGPEAYAEAHLLLFLLKPSEYRIASSYFSRSFGSRGREARRTYEGVESLKTTLYAALDNCDFTAWEAVIASLTEFVPQLAEQERRYFKEQLKRYQHELEGIFYRATPQALEKNAAAIQQIIDLLGR